MQMSTDQIFPSSVGERIQGMRRVPYQMFNTIWIAAGISWFSYIVCRLQAAIEDKLFIAPTRPDRKKKVSVEGTISQGLCELIIHFQIYLFFNLISILTIQSSHNLAHVHVPEAQLLQDVQNYDLVGSYIFTWDLHVIFSRFEWWAHKPVVKWVPAWPLFTKRTDVLLQDIVKSRGREIWV